MNNGGYLYPLQQFPAQLPERSIVFVTISYEGSFYVKQTALL